MVHLFVEFLFGWYFHFFFIVLNYFSLFFNLVFNLFHYCFSLFFIFSFFIV